MRILNESIIAGSASPPHAPKWQKTPPNGTYSSPRRREATMLRMRKYFLIENSRMIVRLDDNAEP
jgi:hypothetical protein